MNERYEQTSERKREWPSILRVDFIVNVPIVLLSHACLIGSFLSPAASAMLTGASMVRTPSSDRFDASLTGSTDGGKRYWGIGVESLLLLLMALFTPWIHKSYS